jgi:hypothetical protein
LLKKHLTFIKKRKKDFDEAKKEEIYSQNVGDSKLPNIIKRLLSEDAEAVIISENKVGNFEVKYRKKKSVIEKEKVENDDKIFKIDI